MLASLYRCSFSRCRTASYRGIVTALTTLVLVLFAAPVELRAQSAKRGKVEVPSALSDAERATVVAKVGDQAITLGDLESRLRAIPPFAMKKYGTTPAEVKKNFLEHVMVRELLIERAANDQGLDKRADILEKRRNILRGALLDSLRKGIKDAPIAEEDVRAYYQANHDKYVAPRRVTMWRILVATEDEAKRLISELKADPEVDVKKWNAAARDKSLDKASSIRSGNLGPMNSDGTTAEPDIHYDPTLFLAADKVKDGELVPEPVKEFEKWAVVWRKQSTRSVTRPFEMEAPGIRTTLMDGKMRQEVETLLAKLRADTITELHPELCEIINITDAGEVEKRKRPGVLPRPKRIVQVDPQPSPIGPR